MFWHIWDAFHNPKIRKILVRGGSSAGKTFGICDVLNIVQLITKYDTSKLRDGGHLRGHVPGYQPVPGIEPGLVNVFALRKHRIHVEGTVKQTFESSITRFVELERFYNKMDGEIRVATGARTFYAGMDDSEKVKGLESFNTIYLNELNQFEPSEWDEINRRLRGRPNQKIIGDWNPIIKTHWINTEILDPSEGWSEMSLRLPEYEKPESEGGFGAFTQLCEGYAFKRINAAGDTIWINVTYRDNYWIIGHPVPGYGFIDTHSLSNFEKMRIKKPNDYRIYGKGEDGLIRTGGEFWKSFTEEGHIRPAPKRPAMPERWSAIDVNLPLHVSADNNANPYVAVSLWQPTKISETKKEIRQVGELPAASPENTAFRAAMKLADILVKINFQEVLIVYGDPSANSKSTTDDSGRSFFDKFIGTLEKRGFKVINRVQASAPGVAISGAFVNDVYEGEIPGWSIVIYDTCPVSIEDYSQVKEAPEGGMLKEKTLDPLDPMKKRKIEKYGHFSDCKRYFIVALLWELYVKYKNRRGGGPRMISLPE